MNATLRRLPIDLGDLTPRIRSEPKPGKVRTATSRAKTDARVAATISALNALSGLNSNKLQIYNSENQCNLIPSYKGVNVTQFQGSIWANKFDRLSKINLEAVDLVDFEIWLKSRSKQKLQGKEDNLLISPSYFEEIEGVITVRGFDNIVFCRGIWLDNDGGGNSPLEFARLFPFLRMTIYSTYSSTKSRLRYRVYIPTDRFMAREDYQAITANLLKKIKEAGYVLDEPIENDPRKCHGFDSSKMGPTSLFYFPCRPVDPSGKFFKTYKDGVRQPLAVDEWNVGAIVEPQPFRALSFSNNGMVDEPRVQRAIMFWQLNGCGKGVGDKQFFRLGQHLAFSGCDQTRIEQTLLEQAGYAHTPKDRRRVIPDIISWLSRHGQLMSA